MANRPKTVQEAYQKDYPDNDWSDWKPTCPDSTREMRERMRSAWYCPWDEDISDRAIDMQRTNALTKWNVPIKCGIRGVRQNVHDGTPFAYVTGMPKYPVFRKGIYFFSPAVKMPLTNPFPRYGDPTWWMGDLATFGIDNEGLWEASSIGPVFWRGGNLEAGRIERWTWTEEWQNHKGGVTAGRLPMMSMLPSIEDLEEGFDFALHLAVHYSPEPAIFPCRGTDQYSRLLKGSPLRCGERGRLRDIDWEQRMGRKLTRQENNARIAMETKGVIVDDISIESQGNLRLPMDHRVDIDMTLFLNDFEIVQPIPMPLAA